jgi:hypothetical protein
VHELVLIKWRAWEFVCNELETIFGTIK